ncbi:MAG TPA: hypothetical protein VFA63_04895 [Pseudonocardiaceae bacterium]|jgi:hypothetical protein|nr:hypothetical protein [Pseudonocardiaceae bacterium]
MSSTAVTEPLSARTFLLGETADNTADVLAQSLNEQGVLQSPIRGLEGLSTSAWQAVHQEIASVVDGLLNLDLGDMVISGWCKYTDLTKAAKRTLASPGSEEVVALATHRIVSTHHPSIDLIVNEAKAHTFKFDLTVTFDITGVAAVVRRGDLVALRGGKCMVTATLELEKTPLELTRKANIDLHLAVPLRRPIALARHASHPPTTPLR